MRLLILQIVYVILILTISPFFVFLLSGRLKTERTLQHPLVKHYLHREWQAFGFWIFFFRLLFSVSFWHFSQQVNWVTVFQGRPKIIKPNGDTQSQWAKRGENPSVSPLYTSHPASKICEVEKF